MVDKELEQILYRIRRLPAELEPFRELLLANLVMIGEIPAPTFGERRRIAFLEQRFTECGLQNCSTDELGNGVAILPGSDGERAILVTAHADTPFADSVDHTFMVSHGMVRGPGVADDSLGLAVLATLPTLLERLNITLASDLILMGATRSLEQGNQEGLRFFLANSKRPLYAGISLEGASLGRLHFRSVASLGSVVSCHVDRRYSQLSAVDVINQVVNRLHTLVLPSQSHTALVLGSISGGSSYKVPARNAQLKFQLRSDSDQVLVDLIEQVDAILDDMGQQAGVSAHLEVIARTRSGGLDSNHPLVVRTRRVMSALDIQPWDTIYSPVISGYVEQEVPAVCIGLTNADNVNYPDESVEIDPILTGVAQLIGILLTIDGGCRAEH
ncbi:peptidase [Thermodesulfobacteriota bacterium B35]